MKSIRLVFCVSALAVLGLLAVSGGASAATLCKVNKSPCPAGQSYAPGSELTADLEAGTKWELMSQYEGYYMPSSHIKIKINEAGAPRISEWNTSASPTCGATAWGLPLSASWKVTNSILGNGTLTVEKPFWSLDCGPLIRGTFSISSMVAALDSGQGGSEGNDAKLTFDRAILVAGETGNYFFLTAHYRITSAGGVTNPPVYLIV